MYKNISHKEKVNLRGDGYEYIGSYKIKDITIDGKNKNGKVVYIRVKCPYCNEEYDVRYNSFVTRSHKCSNCCNDYENSFAYYIQQELKEPLNKYWDWEKNTINPYLIHKSSNKKVWIKCTEKDYHGSYLIELSNFYIGRRCSYCARRKIHPKDSFAQWGIDKFGNDFLEKYWSDKNTLNPWKVSPQTNKTIYIYCQEKEYHNDYGGYPTTPNMFYKGARCGYCHHLRVHPKDSFGGKYPEKAKYWSSNNKISPYEVSPKVHRSYKFICEKCDEEFEKRLDSLNQADSGVVCHKCNGSQGETRIIRWSDKNNKTYIHDEYYFNDLLGIKNSLLRPDFIYPQEKIWIEYDGAQHDEWQEGWQSKDNFITLQANDKVKDLYAREHGWKLIRIKAKDFNNIEFILEDIFNGLYLK